MAQKDLEEKIILVWSAGNANGRDCTDSTPQCVGGKVNAESVELLAGLAARIPELRSHTVSVVSVREEDGAISDFSNRCGIAADYCLAAPGEAVRVAYFGPHPDTGPGARGYATWDGTSFAAPMVTGGLALMKQYFRDQLSNTDLLARLLRTADRTGQYADAAIYGQGLLDLGAATTPVGNTAIALGSRVDDPGTVLDSSGLRLGAAFGDGLASALDGRQIAAFDALGAPFWYDLDDFTSATPRPSLSERLRGFQRAMGNRISFPLLDLPPTPHGRTPLLRLSESGTSSSEKASHLAFDGASLIAVLPAAASLTATAVTTDGIAGQAPASGAALSWRPPGALVGLHAGWMGEEQTLLGSASGGAFGSLAGQAVFTGIEANAEFGPWRLGATAEIGSVSAQPRGGLIGEISPLATSAFALHANRSAADGSAWRLSLSQPLRIESGHALLDVPSGRTKAGDVVSQRPVRRSRAQRTAGGPGPGLAAATGFRRAPPRRHALPRAWPPQACTRRVDSSLGLAPSALSSPAGWRLRRGHRQNAARSEPRGGMRFPDPALQPVSGARSATSSGARDRLPACVHAGLLSCLRPVRAQLANPTERHCVSPVPRRIARKGNRRTGTAARSWVRPGSACSRAPARWSCAGN